MKEQAEAARRLSQWMKDEIGRLVHEHVERLRQQDREREHQRSKSNSWHMMVELRTAFPRKGQLMSSNSQLTGAAGVHFVAARMNALGLHAAPTIRNVPGVDLLVSSLDGRKSAAIQVKTTEWASRTRGKGENKVIWEYQWACKFIEEKSESLFYAFVDLKNFDELPDIYLLPSHDVAKWYRDAGIKREEWKWPRFHAEASFIAKYRNEFEPIFKALR